LAAQPIIHAIVGSNFKKMNALGSILLLSLLLGCNFSNNKLNEDVRINSIVKSKNLQFSLKNNTIFELHNVFIGLPDTNIRINNLMPKSQTNWMPVHSAYRYGALRIEDLRDSIYYYAPIDYVGEELYDTGRMTYIIEYIDTIKYRISLSHNYE
jgi:hypothetical protein